MLESNHQQENIKTPISPSPNQVIIGIKRAQSFKNDQGFKLEQVKFENNSPNNEAFRTPAKKISEPLKARYQQPSLHPHYNL